MRSVRIPLRSRKYPGLYAIVDECDADRVRQHEWNPHRGDHTFYAYVLRSTAGGQYFQMHRFILGLGPDDPAVDHIDGNGLNNTRENLRFCNDSQNQANRHRMSSGRSRFRGVCWHKQRKKWMAGIKVMGKRYHLGLYVSEEEAARAYDSAARAHFGEFARLNFPEVE